MSGLVEAGAGVLVVVVFAVLSCGQMARRLYRPRPRREPGTKTRPTIPNLVALPRPGTARREYSGGPSVHSGARM